MKYCSVPNLPHCSLQEKLIFIFWGILFLNLVSSFTYFQMSRKMYGGHHINKYKNNIFQYVDEFKKIN